MAPSTSMEIPNGCIIPQGFTINYWSWKPSLRLRWLFISPLQAFLPCLASLLLLCNSLGLVFVHRARPPCLHYLLTFLLSLSFRVSRFRSGWQRRLRRRRGKFGLSGSPWGIFSGLRLY